MLEYEDELLLEQYITYNHMSSDTRDLCINIIRNLKDVSCSEKFLDSKSDRSYRIVTMNLVSKGNEIAFNGAIVNNDECRYLDGTIRRHENQYCVRTSVYRLDKDLCNCEREYATFDCFTVSQDGIRRESSYNPHISNYVDEIKPFSYEDLYDYYLGLIDRKRYQNLL